MCDDNDVIVEAYMQVLQESRLGNLVATGALTLGSLVGTPNADAKPKPHVKQEQTSNFTGKYINMATFNKVKKIQVPTLTEGNYNSWITTFIKGYEGYRATAYTDPAGEGKIAVGYGFELNGNTAQVEYMGKLGLDFNKVKNKKQQVSEKQAMQLLTWHIEHQAIPDCQKYYKDFANLPPNVKAALIDLSYNNGLTRMLKYKGVKAGLMEHNYNKAAFNYIDSKEYNKCIQNAWTGKIDRLNKCSALIASCK